MSTVAISIEPVSVGAASAVEATGVSSAVTGASA
jgi:hypothetical protein